MVHFAKIDSLGIYHSVVTVIGRSHNAFCQLLILVSGLTRTGCMDVLIISKPAVLAHLQASLVRVFTVCQQF